QSLQFVFQRRARLCSRFVASGRAIARAGAENGLRFADGHTDFAITPVARGVGRVIAKPVVTAQLLGDVRKRLFGVADGRDLVIPPAARGRQIFQTLRRLFIFFDDAAAAGVSDVGW